MINEKTFLCLPSQFKNLCLIYPPKVIDVVSNENFFTFKKMLTITHEEIEDEYVEKGLDLKGLINPLEYILNAAYNNINFEKLLKQAFYFFIKEDVHFLYTQKAIVIGSLDKDLKQLESIGQLRVLRENDYFDFQNAVRVALGEKTVELPNVDEDPRIKKMKAKARYRDKIKAKQDGLNLSTILASICCMGIGLNPLNIGELSYGTLSFLLRTYQEKEKYEIDIKSLLAGASSKDVKPEHWIRNLKD